jgi:hypothetical protein
MRGVCTRMPSIYKQHSSLLGCPHQQRQTLEPPGGRDELPPLHSFPAASLLPAGTCSLWVCALVC